jgi:predicted double-glycine peptidase
MLEILVAALTIFQASYILEPNPQPEGTVYFPRPHQERQTIQSTTVTPYSEFKWRNLVRQQYDFSCGSAALSTILKFYIGEDLSEIETMRGMLEHGERQQIIQRQGFSLLDMKRYVNFLGYEGNGFRAVIEDLRDLDRPAIIPIQYGGFDHFVILRHINEDRAFVADPAFGNITVTITKFKEIWEPDVLFLMNQGDQVGMNKLRLSDRDLRFTAIQATRGDEDSFARFDLNDQLREASERAIQNSRFFQGP